MSESITRAILAHKQLVIAAAALAVLASFPYASDAVAQLPPGIVIDIGEYGNIHLEVDGIVIDLPGLGGFPDGFPGGFLP